MTNYFKLLSCAYEDFFYLKKVNFFYQNIRGSRIWSVAKRLPNIEVDIRRK